MHRSFPAITGSRYAAFLSMAVLFVPWVSAQTPADLQACLDDPSNTECRLNGTYWIAPTAGYYTRPETGTVWAYAPIRVRRGNVVITPTPGLSSYLNAIAGGTSGDWQWMMEIDFASPPGSQGVRIQNIGFDNPYQVPYMSQLVILQADIYQGQPDLWPANPFANQAPYSVTVDNCAFWRGQGEFGDPPHGGFRIWADAAEGRYVNDVFIHETTFDHSTLWIYAEDPYGYANKPGHACDSLSNYANTSATHNPRNIRIEGNSFYNAGQGALTGNQSRWAAVRNNTFFNDEGVHRSGTDEGGVLYFGECSDTIEITGNTLIGAPASVPDVLISGMELYAQNMLIANNAVTAFAFNGIAVSNATNVQILNNTVNDNNRLFQYGGITIWDLLSTGDPEYNRVGSSIYVDGNQLGNLGTNDQKYGLRMGYYNSAPPPTGVTLGPNNNWYYGRGNSWGAACADYPSPYYPYGSPPSPPQGVSYTGYLPWVACQ